MRAPFVFTLVSVSIWLVLVPSTGAFAQAAPLKGQVVHVDTLSGDAMQGEGSTVAAGSKSRAIPHTNGPTQRSRLARHARDSVVLSGATNVDDFSFIPLHASRATSSHNQPSPPMEVVTPNVSLTGEASLRSNPEPPYIWHQSGTGGYYDGSGTTRDVVPAIRLHHYGGRFSDGTPVPSQPIVHQNAAGHAYKQSVLTSPIFWTH